MRLLDRKRSDGVAGYSIMLAGENYPLAAEKTFYDIYSLGQPIDPDGTSIKVYAKLFIFGSDAAGAEAKFKSSICQEVDRRGFTSDKHGVAQVVVQHVRPDPQVLGCFCGYHQRRYWSNAVTNVVGKSESGIA